jgi:hypothetical protein
MIKEETYLEALKIVQAYHLQLQQPLVMYQLKGDYTEHFLEWRNRFFEVDIEIREWKTKNKGTRYTTDELHKRYETAMLQSPFDCT